MLEPLRPSAMDGVKLIAVFLFGFTKCETHFQVQMEDIFKDTLQQSEIKLQILSEQNMIAALDVRHFELRYLTSCYAACSKLLFATCRCLFQSTVCRQYQVDCQTLCHERKFKTKKYLLAFMNLITTVPRASHHVPLDAVKEEVERTQKMLHQERNVKVGSRVSSVCK